MRRIWLIAAVAAVIIGVLWLAEDGELGRISSLGDGSDRTRPSWGDVAGKVGDFAEEERQLQNAISGQEQQAEGTPAESAPAEQQAQ